MEAWLDRTVGDNVRLLPDVLRSLKKLEKVLRGQLVEDGNVTGNKWLVVVSDVQDSVSSLQALHATLQPLSQQFQPEGGSGWEKEVGTVAKGVATLVKEMTELEHAHSYLTWLNHISALSAGVEAHASTSPGSQAMQHYEQLCEVGVALEQSHCQHLRHWACSLRVHWNQTLKAKFSSWFSSLLMSVSWPLTSTSSMQQLDSWSSHYNTFSLLFTHLLTLDHTPSLDVATPFSSDAGNASLASESHTVGVATSSAPTGESVSVCGLSDALALPMELMVLPLRKRFRYHFMEDRKTNRLDKPEWYLTQVSTWLKDHLPILKERVQPVLDQTHTNLNAKVEFIRGLFQEVSKKVEADLNTLCSQDAFLAHLIDELLLFEQELRDVLSTHSLPPSSCASLTLLHLLQDTRPFHKWRNLEKAYAVEQLKEMTLSESAWTPAYKGMDDVDASKVPQCTEDLMMLIRGITERYRFLPSQQHRLMFLELQVDLLLEFHQDLSDSAHKTHPLHPQFAAYFNASSYIATLLRFWGEETFFLELLYFSKRSSGGDSASEEESASLPSSVPVQSLKLLRESDLELRRGEGSVFETAAGSFSSLVLELETILVSHVLSKAREACKKYRAERWHNMKDHSDQLCMQVSPGAADLLTLLSEHLLVLEEYVSVLLFGPLMEKMVLALDQLILTEIILCSNFTEGGVKQLSFDLAHYFVPLVKGHCDDVLSRQLFLKCCEAVSLLSLLPGSAQLLKQVLTIGLESEQSLVEAVRALEDVKVHDLSPEQARAVLKRRIYST